MRTTQKIGAFFPAIAGFIVVILIGFTYPVHCQGGNLPEVEKNINISPNIISLVSAEHSFGIHSNIWFASIDTSTVQILCADGTVMDDEVFCYADSRGYLVANSSTVNLGEFCKPPDAEYYTLMLTGESKLTLENPYAFYGEGEVMVIYGKPKFRATK